MSKYIEVEVDKSGNVKVEAHGYSDGMCFAATKEIEEAIGKKEKDTTTHHGGPVKAKAILGQ